MFYKVSEVFSEKGEFLKLCHYLPLTDFLDKGEWETCTVCNVSYDWSKELKNEQQNKAARHKTMELQVITIQWQ